jgi:hypothetical protein
LLQDGYYVRDIVSFCNFLRFVLSAEDKLLRAIASKRFNLRLQWKTVHKSSSRRVPKRIAPEELLINRRMAIAPMLPMLIEELPHIQDACFIELAVRILYKSKIGSSPIGAYALSIICLLLGMIGPQRALKPLWDRFHFFKERYPEENFSQGPLLGLYELYDTMPLLCGARTS